MADQKTEKRKEIQFVVFRVGNEAFGIDISSVLEISRMRDITHIPQAPGFIEGVVNLRGHVIAVINSAKQFGLKDHVDTQATSKIVVFNIHGQTMGLIVDEVYEVLRIAVDEIEPTPEIIQSDIKKDYIKGVAKIGDRLIILVDMSSILMPHEVKDIGNIIQ